MDECIVGDSDEEGNLEVSKKIYHILLYICRCWVALVVCFGEGGEVVAVNIASLQRRLATQGRVGTIRGKGVPGHHQ